MGICKVSANLSGEWESVWLVGICLVSGSLSYECKFVWLFGICLFSENCLVSGNLSGWWIKNCIS